MADITTKVEAIRAADFGRDVRETIASGIESINEEVESTTGKQEELEIVFNDLVINAGSENAEIVLARGLEDSLPIRLNKVDTALADIAYNFDAVYPRVIPEVNDYGRIVRAIAGIPLGSNLLIPNNLNYDFGGNDIVINRAINIKGESRPVFDPLTDTFVRGAIFNTKVFINTVDASVKNIGINAPTKDNGFQIDQGAAYNIEIDHCITNVLSHGYLIQSYNGYVDKIIVKDCLAFNSVHGFISKALGVKFINCNAFDMAVGMYGMGFGFISDNIQGAANKGLCKDNKAINCHAYNSPYGFSMYSRDCFSDSNANGIEMAGLTLTDCGAYNCIRSLSIGEVNDAPEGQTNNRVYDITVINWCDSGSASSIEFNRCDRVKVQGIIRGKIFLNNVGTQITNIEYDVICPTDYKAVSETQVINNNLAALNILFRYRKENIYSLQNTVATTINSILGNMDKDKIITLRLDEDFTTIQSSSNLVLKKLGYYGKGSWVKLYWDGIAWVEIDGYNAPKQQQININTTNSYLNLMIGTYIDVVGTGTTPNKIKIPYSDPNYYTGEMVVTFLIRSTSGAMTYGGFDTANLVQPSVINTTLSTFGIGQTVIFKYNKFLNKWVCIDCFDTKYA